MDRKKAAKKQLRGFPGFQPGYLGSAVILLFLTLCGSVTAFEIPTGIDNIILRWDNTFRYNLGYRLTDPSDALLKNVNMDDGNRNFDKAIVSNRLDILSEFDIQYKRRYGARISAAGWYDNAYEGSLENQSVATSNHMENGLPALGINDTTKFYHRGPNGEILDAFVFGSIDFGNVPVNMRLGRMSIVWGESLFSLTHGIGYAQVPLDALKGAAVPGVEVKELYRPVFNAYAQAQLASNLSIAAQWKLQWEPNRIPEAGSYYSSSDMLLGAGETLISGPIRFRKADDAQPTGKGDWGVMVRWSPDCFKENGAIGLYYRRLSDTSPQLILNPFMLQYYAAYGDAIDLYGISFTRQILSTSLGAEVSYRRNMPLNGDTAISAVRPKEGELFGPRGNTMHAVLNAIIPWSKPFDAKFTRIDLATISTEVYWSRWDSVSQGYNLFKGRPSYTAMDRVTENNAGITVAFTPSWYSFLPGWDLSMPITYGAGLYGNSAVAGGGSEHAGSYSFGFVLDGFARYNFSLKYSNYFGEYDVGPTGALRTTNGATLFDRGTILFTFKTTL